MGPLGWQETIFIFILALLIFGPKKLPELGKTIGKAMTEFRRASSELKSTWDREMASIERETESMKEVTSSYHHEINQSVAEVSHDTHSYYDSGYEYGSDYGYTSETDSSTVGATATTSAELTADASTAGGTEPTTTASSTAEIAPAAHGETAPTPAPPSESKPVQA